MLGSCAGGGLPQWNCGGPNSLRARRGDPALPPRSQSCLAVSADGQRWSLLGASPDLRQQLADFPPLHPRPGSRDVPLDTVVLANAELDHILGLLVMRDALSYRIVSTHWVRQVVLEHNAAFWLLEPVWGARKLDEPIALDREGLLEARLFPLPGRVPGYLGDLASRHPECCVGIRLTDTRSGSRLVFAPGLRSLDSGSLAELAAADCRFVDGTFFHGDELRALRPGAPDAVAMGHLPIGGADGSLAALRGLPGRTLYVHINNTNPVLDAGSPEAAELRRAGLEIAADGQELEI